jgi:hypothetical protein
MEKVASHLYKLIEVNERLSELLLPVSQLLPPLVQLFPLLLPLTPLLFKFAVSVFQVPICSDKLCGWRQWWPVPFWFLPETKTPSMWTFFC